MTFQLISVEPAQLAVTSLAEARVRRILLQRLAIARLLAEVQIADIDDIQDRLLAGWIDNREALKAMAAIGLTDGGGQ